MKVDMLEAIGRIFNKKTKKKINFNKSKFPKKLRLRLCRQVGENTSVYAVARMFNKDKKKDEQISQARMYVFYNEFKSGDYND